MLLEIGTEQITSTAFSSPYPFWLQTLLYVGIVGPIGWVLYYLKEKGKNAATSEDIGKITKSIASIQKTHNEALEHYKIELQKEFEHHKYIEELCHEIDHFFIKKIIACLDIEPVYINPHRPSERLRDDTGLVEQCKQLHQFLKTYGRRYKDNKKISELFSLLEQAIECSKHFHYHKALPKETYDSLNTALNDVLELFLPRF